MGQSPLELFSSTSMELHDKSMRLYQNVDWSKRGHWLSFLMKELQLCVKTILIKSPS